MKKALSKISAQTGGQPKSSTMAEQVWRSNIVGQRKVTTSLAYIEVQCSTLELVSLDNKPSDAAFSIIICSTSMIESKRKGKGAPLPQSMPVIDKVTDNAVNHHPRRSCSQQQTKDHGFTTPAKPSLDITSSRKAQVTVSKALVMYSFRRMASALRWQKAKLNIFIYDISSRATPYWFALQTIAHPMKKSPPIIPRTEIIPSNYHDETYSSINLRHQPLVMKFSRSKRTP
jgi:hypothetical protein